MEEDHVDASVDPFAALGRLHWSHWITGAVLVPWRLRLLAGMSAAGVAVAYGSTLLDRVRGRAGPATPDMLRVRVFQRLARAMTFVMGYYRVETVGAPAGRGGGDARPLPVVVANHVSLLDAFFLLASPLAPGFLIKAEVLSMPVFGPVARALGCVAVQRASADSRADAMAQLRAYVARPDAPPLVVFPEGTTGNGAGLLRFRKGAFALGLPVQPVAVAYPTADGFSPTFPPHASSLTTFLSILARPRNRVRLCFLPPIVPEPEDLRDPARYAVRVERVIAAALGVPATTYTVADFVRIQKARR